MVVFLFILLSFAAVSAQKNSELNALRRLPQHFHLDDYHKCLSRQNGLYCFGTFELSPTKSPHPIYEYIKDYSSITAYHLNRTRIHRGYCISKRCPPYTGNASSRFENCVAEWAKPRSFHAHLLTESLHYCKSHDEVIKPRFLDTPEILFLCIVVAILLANVFGTVYDFICKDTSKGGPLRTWSVPANWKRLMNMQPGKESRLNDLLPLHGLKAFVVMIGVAGHSYGEHFVLLDYYPHKMETLTRSSMFSMGTNGAAAISLLLSISAFITSYNLLLVSEKLPLSIKMLPLCILKRMIRLTPLFLLMVGFSATWWPRIGDGPMWIHVEHERDVCRRKFWASVVYANNMVYMDQQCVGTTWGLTVDMQLSIIVCILTLVLARFRRGALPVIACLLVISCFSNTILGYVFEWVPFREFSTPEIIHRKFANVDSFKYFYSQPWGGLPSSLVGVFVAHLHYELQGEKFDVTKHKWLNTSISNLSALPLVVIMVAILLGHNHGLSRVVSALYIGFERPVMSIFGMLANYSYIVVKGNGTNFLNWSGFQVLGRLTLPIAAGSLIVNTTLVAARPQPNIGTGLDILVDIFATYVLTVLVAIPITVLVEIPIRRFLDYLLFSPFLKKYE